MRARARARIDSFTLLTLLSETLGSAVCFSLLEPRAPSRNTRFTVGRCTVPRTGSVAGGVYTGWVGREAYRVVYTHHGTPWYIQGGIYPPWYTLGTPWYIYPTMVHPGYTLGIYASHTTLGPGGLYAPHIPGPRKPLCASYSLLFLVIPGF